MATGRGRADLFALGAMATGRGRADLFALGACLRLFLRPAADEQLTVLATLHPNNTSNPR